VSDLSHHNGIVVGVESSPGSKLAVEWAAREAAMRNVPLRIVHAAYPTVGAWAGWGMPAPPPEGFAHMQEALEDQARKVIDEATGIVDAAIEGNDRLEVSSEIVWLSPAAALVDRSEKAQMIVVGYCGQGALERGLPGSVSTALIYYAHCPVAVIHDDAPQPFGPTGPPVLVGIDGSPASELATAIAFDEASWRGVDLVALHACSDAQWPDLPELEWSAIQATAEETLGERLAGWGERYPNVTVRKVVVSDHPAHHLLEASISAQLVVVGSHGRGGFAGMLLGSVSSTIAHAAPVPVIVARGR